MKNWHSKKYYENFYVLFLRVTLEKGANVQVKIHVAERYQRDNFSLICALNWTFSIVHLKRAGKKPLK